MTSALRRRRWQLLLGALLGCSAPAPGPPAPAGADGWVRVVAPFEVLDADGRPYAFPFLGGYNLPRPQLVDIDADGDDDLFVQEATGSVAFFERVEASPPRFEWRSDRYQDLDVGEWYRFVDLDRDGDQDLLAEQPFSYIRYYRNDGDARRARFVLAADSLRDTEGRPLFSDRQNIPNATDIDCDGQMDLLIGRLTGSISRYEQVGATDDAVPRFELVTDRFEGISIIARIGSAHGANTMALADIDGDGDEDLFWGDFFEPGILFIENRGSCRSPDLRGEPAPFPLGDPLRTSGYNAPTVGDVDGDGDADMLVGVLGGAYNPNTSTIDNLYELEQVAAGRFRVSTSRFVSMLDVGSESVPVLFDIDGDGDLDLLVGNKIEPDDPGNGGLYLFLNEGSPTRPRLRLHGKLDLGSGYDRIPAFGDLDGDGVADVVLGTWEDELSLYMGVPPTSGGIMTFTLVDSAVVKLSRGRNAVPALGDVDGDGDLDLFVGESSGTLNYFENVGGPRSPEFSLVSDAFAGIDVGRRSFPVLHDVDGDGDLDLLVGSETEGIRLFRNVGTPTSARFEGAGEPLAVEAFGFAAPALADLDGDGDDDLVLGGTGGGLWYYENRRR